MLLDKRSLPAKAPFPDRRLTIKLAVEWKNMIAMCEYPFAHTHVDRCEALPVFRAHYLLFDVSVPAA